MSAGRTPNFKYRSNGIIKGKQPLGRKVQDEVTGFWTYEDLLTTNDFGERVDSRTGDGLDYRADVYNVRNGS